MSGTCARQPLPHDPDEVKDQLRQNILTVLSRLGFDTGKVQRDGALMPLNPMRNDRHAGSFVIWTTGEFAGAWKDYATGESGNIYDLIEGVLRLARWIDAYWWALDCLGLGRGTVRSKTEEDAAKVRLERDRKAAEAKAQADEEGKIGEVFKTWLSCAPLAGTLAEVYLREARGIPLDLLPRLPKAIRFAKRLEHWHPETGEITEWPAMVTAQTRGKRVTAIHRTYLAPDGKGKAPLFLANGKSCAKLMKGSSRGTAMRLSNGARDITINKALEAGYTCPLILGEGAESTLSAAVAQPDYRAWAAGSLGNMINLEWPETATHLFLLGENDGSPAARAGFDRAIAHFKAQAKGRELRPVFPPAGASDFNEWRARA